MVAETVRNWAETYSTTPRVLHRASTVEELAAALADARSAGAQVRVIGAAQSPSDIAMSQEHLIAVRGLNRVRSVDRERCEVMAEAGITLGALSAALAREGLALPNLGSILRQTLGGAASTGTHGTGVAWGSVPTWIEEMELLSVAGELLQVTRESDPELFAGGRLALGSLGVHTAFKLKVVPAFDLRVEEGPVALEAALRPEWYGGADHARVWYLPFVEHAWGWRAWRLPAGPGSAAPRRPPSVLQQLKERGLGYHGFQAGLRAAASVPSLLPRINRAYSQEFLSKPRASTGGSVQQFTFDCLFHQRVAEWAVPLAVSSQAVLAVRELSEKHGFQAHLPVEVRYTAGDDLWLSPTYDGARCWVGIVSYIPWGREVAWRAWFSAVEELMLSLGGRPHWAKEFAAGPAQLQRLYPQWEAFARLRERMDPEGRLRNAYTDRVFEASPNL